MTTANNALLFNAALSGIIAGVVKDRYLTAVNSGTPPAIGTRDPSYQALNVQAAEFAALVDAAIPNDHVGAAQPTGTEAISVVTTGVAIVPSTGALQFGQLMKTLLLEAACLGVVEGRYYGQPTETNMAQVSPLAVASYLDLASAVIQPFPGSPVINNQLLYESAAAGMLAGVGLGNPGQIPSDEAVSVLAFCQEIGLAVDALIAPDATITTGSSNGVTLPPSTAIIQMAQLAKTRLMYSCVLAVMEKRNPLSLGLSTTPAIQAWAQAEAPAIVALYKATVANLVIVDNPGVLNPILYNEALCAFIAGNIAGRPITSTSSTDANYVAVGIAASAFATAVDANVGASDVTGTPVPTGTQAITEAGEGGNEAIPPTTGTIQEGELGKRGLMWAICRGVQHGRPLIGNPTIDVAPATYVPVAKSIVALYLILATTLTTP